jgi:hypothetical protein
VIEAAVTDAPGPIEFYEIPATGLSTGSKEIAKQHSAAGYSPRKITAPCIRLDELLKLIEGDIHWLKIDVEGMEAEALRSWGKSPIRPWIMTIEATLPNTQIPTNHLWIDEVLSRDYEPVFFDGLSRYFLHKSRHELASRFEAPANVFDAFVVAPHHFSATEMRGQLDATRQRLDFEWARAEQNAAELSVARTSLEDAREEQRGALERLVAAEQAHRTSIEAYSSEWRNAEQQFRESEKELRREASEAQATAAAANAALARFEERSDQLQTKLRFAEELNRDAAQRLEQSTRETRVLRAELELSRQTAEQTAAELSSALMRLQREREEAESELERQRAQTARSAAEQVMEVERLSESLAQAEQRAERESVENERLRAELARADALIKTAAAQRPGKWQRLGEALGLAEPAEVTRVLFAWQAPPNERKHDLEGSALLMAEIGRGARRPHAGARNPYLRANTLDELLTWDDVDFVRCAYVTILGRQPDQEGESYYTERLRRGRSKMEVLWNLRHSPEAPRHDPGIAGLDRALKRARWRRFPLLRQFTRGSGGQTGRVSSTSSIHVEARELSPLSDQLAAVADNMEKVRQSISSIERSLLETSDRNETVLPLDRDSFMRRLAATARDFEGVAE